MDAGQRRFLRERASLNHQRRIVERSIGNLVNIRQSHRRLSEVPGGPERSSVYQLDLNREVKRMEALQRALIQHIDTQLLEVQAREQVLYRNRQRLENILATESSGPSHEQEENISGRETEQVGEETVSDAETVLFDEEW